MLAYDLHQTCVIPLKQNKHPSIDLSFSADLEH